MSARIAAALALSLAAQPALADHATHRGGSGTASTSSHTSRGGASSRTSSPTLSDAQRRHPRAGTGRYYYGGGYYHPRYRSYGYYGYSYPGFYPYFDFYWGGYPYYWGGYGYRGYGYYYRDAGSLRLKVEPSETRVYVDGYYAGIVDDFDGLFQRLHVAPGRHELTFKLEGYRTHRMRVYVPYGDTLKIHYEMAKGAGEDSFEDLTGDRYEPETRDRGAAGAADEARPERGERGELRLEIRPADASVYVDGEFRGSGRDVGSLDLRPGRHRVEVVRPGYRTFDREIEVGADQPTDLDIELER